MFILYTRKDLVSIVFFVLSLSLAHAQYYPGGLGNTHLKLWLTGADATTLLKSNGSPAGNGDRIATWSDLSGNNNDATQTFGLIQPALKTNALNGNSAVIFQNVLQELTGPSGAYRTIVSVRDLPGTGTYQTLFASPANSDFSIRGGAQGASYTGGPNAKDWVYNTGATPTEWTNGVQTLNSSTTNHILVASAAAATNATYSVSSSLNFRGMTGNDPVYEILAYNTTLNTTQRRIIENYEASLWGLSAVLPTSGYTIFTPPATGSYNKNLIGIGFTSAADNVLSIPSGNTDGLGFSSTSGATGFLHSAGFLMAAHNGQSNTVRTNPSLAGVTSTSTLNVWNRAWYVERSGGNSTGTVTISLNFSDYNGTTPATTNTYALIYNPTDGSFASIGNRLIATAATSVSGGTVSFKVTAGNLPNGYYSIVYSASPISLPLELTAFTVANRQGGALLSWTAEQATNVDHFDIQRSTDGAVFTTIGSVTARNEASATAYTFTDNAPQMGLDYYRLAIVDRDDGRRYSRIATFESASAAVMIHLYPNPVVDMLHMTTGGTAPLDILIVDVRGRILRRVNQASGSVVDIPVNQLPKGVYFAVVVTGQSKFIRTFMKN